jgi:hypothetical protein
MIRKLENHAASVKKAVKTLSSAKGSGLVISERDGRTHIRLIGETSKALQVIQMALTENPFLHAMAQHVSGPKITYKKDDTEAVIGEGIDGIEEGGTPNDEPAE